MRKLLVLLCLLSACRTEQARESARDLAGKSFPFVTSETPRRTSRGFEIADHPELGAHAILPERADQSAQLVHRGRSISIAALDLESVAGVEDRGAVVFAKARPATDVVMVPRVDGYEELRVLRDARAPSTMRFRVDGDLPIRVRDRYVELVDGERVVFVASPMHAVDANGVSRALDVRVEDRVVTASLDTKGLEYPITVDPVWSTMPSAPAGGAASFSVTLADGRVMISTPNGPAAAYIFNGATNTWSTYMFPSGWSNSGAGATLLADGRVLVVDGASALSARFNPATGTFTATAGNPSQSCAGNCAMATAGDGRALFIPNTGMNIQVFNPSTGTWASASYGGGVSSPPAATTLKDGKVMMMGVLGQTAIVWDPATSAWTAKAGAKARMDGPRLVTLNNGKVLMTGNVNTSGAPPTAAQLYDPVANSWIYTLPVGRVRYSPALVVMPSGRVLAAGGENAQPGSVTKIYDENEVYDPVFNSWTFIDPMPELKGRPGYGLLADGSVLVAAGVTTFGAGTASALRYTPLADGSACGGPGAVTCAAPYCVDGVCCESATCPSGTCAAAAGAGRPAGVCSSDLGVACSKDADCSSNHCADGVCCNVACGGQCQACNLPATKGTCSPVLGAPVAPRAACAGSGPCGASCNGIVTTACTFPGAGVACGTDSCTAGVETKSGSCNGAGACTTTTNPCGAYGCGATLCKHSCVADADCASGYYCGGDECRPVVGKGTDCSATAMCPSGLFCTDGVCCEAATCGEGGSCALAGKKGTCSKTAGAACAMDSDCGSGFCTDGVCCDRRCDAQCEACDQPATKGTCSAVSGDPRGSRPACDAPVDDKCKALECDGAKDATKCTKFKNGGTVTCKPPSCSGSSVIPTSTCDGAGACVTPPTSDCGRYACDPATSQCRSSCATSVDCAMGFSCVAGTCSEGARCSDDGLSSTSTDGKTQACSPYRCNSGGTCNDHCTTSEECAPGSVCDGAKCAEAVAAEESSGGCAYGRGTAAHWLVLLAAIGWLKRLRG